MSYKIPQNNKFYVSNGSDLTPNIQYTKNIDMDEEGYLKLSPPFPKLTSDNDIANFSILADVMKYGGTLKSAYKMVTSDKIYTLILANSLVPTLDGAAPSGRASARWVGWILGNAQRAYVAVISGIWSFDATTNTIPATETWQKGNTTVLDFNEVFVNRNTLVGSSGGSSVRQYLVADMNDGAPPATHAGQTLTIPANFEVLGMSYSNYRVGIVTRDKNTSMAFFFTWDGATSDASQGFPANAQMILDIVAYKNSWAMLTSAGQLLYFNGGGFDVLGNLPSYYFNIDWTQYAASQDHGRSMLVDGDVIYFNLGSLVSSNKDFSGLVKGFYSGVWCYDPAIKSIYHRYALSHSQVISNSLTASSGIFTSSAHLLESGDRVRYSSNKIYFAIKLSVNTFKLADTYDLAVAGTATSDSVSGGASVSLIWIQRTDWSQLTSQNQNTGAVTKFTEGRDFINTGLKPFFIGSGINTKVLGYHNVTSIMAPLFDNIGMVCYQKFQAKSLEDTWNSIIVKFRKLYEGDKIVVKCKLSDAYDQIAVGEANDSTPDVFISWSNSTTFTTTNDLTGVSEGDEVEFFQGAGAGSTAHISSITNVAGTWTVVVDEEIRGAVSGNKSTCIFDSFKKLGTVTKSNTELPNQARFAIDTNSKWIHVKLELRGRDVAIEGLIINNQDGSPIV